MKRVTACLFSGEDDLEVLKRFVMQIWAKESYRSYLHVGDLLWGIYQNTLFDPFHNICLWQNLRGELLGFTFFESGRTSFGFYIVVHPAHRENADLYDDMLVWLDERAAVEHEKDATKNSLHTDVYDDDIELQGALQRHNYERGDLSLVHFARALDDLLPEPVLSAGWQVRNVMGEEEWEARVEIHREVWHPSRVTLEAYRRLRGVAGYMPELDLVCVDPEGTFASYCICWYDPQNRCGQFEPVGTRAAFRKQGSGKALMYEGMRRLQALGATRVGVNTNYPNTAARSLYESVGFQLVANDRDYAKKLG